MNHGGHDSFMETYHAHFQGLDALVIFDPKVARFKCKFGKRCTVTCNQEKVKIEIESSVSKQKVFIPRPWISSNLVCK